MTDNGKFPDAEGGRAQLSNKAEVPRSIRGHERTKLLPVVILTSSKAEQDIINSYKLGANSYIQNPLDFNQFVESIKNPGLYWLVLSEPPPLKVRTKWASP